MAIWYFVNTFLIVIWGIILTMLVLRLSKSVTSAQKIPKSYTHIRYYQNREEFNALGIEIVNGTVANDTVYLIMRSGTFSDKFTKAISRFRSHDNTKLIVVTPNSEVFLSNCRDEFQEWITDLYENPYCGEIRGMLLVPGEASPSDTRMRGYLLFSDGHIHADDDGFYTNTHYAARFLLGYFKSLIDSGKQIELPYKKN